MIDSPVFTENSIITSFDLADLYDEPHEAVVEHLQKIYEVIEKMAEEDEKYSNHGIFPTIHNDVKYFELNKDGFDSFKSHAPDGKSEKWQKMYLRFWHETHKSKSQT